MAARIHDVAPTQIRIFHHNATDGRSYTYAPTFHWEEAYDCQNTCSDDRSVPALVVLAVLCVGAEGHRIVALVAGAHLTSAARQGVRDLLGVETDNRIRWLSAVAIWPDLIKGDRPETKP